MLAFIALNNSWKQKRFLRKKKKKQTRAEMESGKNGLLLSLGATMASVDLRLGLCGSQNHSQRQKRQHARARVSEPSFQ